MKKKYKQIIGITVLVTILAACSDGGFDAVSENIAKAPEKVQETMEPIVQVHSVAGSTDGVIFQVDERSKWIVTEASIFRDHPKALVVTSEGQQVEGALIAFNIEQNEAIVHIRNSASVEAVQQVRQTELEQMLERPELTAKERYTLHTAFAEATIPQKYDATVLADYEKETFDYNPDALQAFVEQFNASYNQYVATGEMTALKELILADLLVEAFEQAENKRYIQNFTTTAVTKAGFEWVVKGTSADLTITYKIILANGQYYITYFMVEE